MKTITYRLFGIPIWSVVQTVDEEAIYKRMSDRFKAEMEDALRRAQEGRK